MEDEKEVKENDCIHNFKYSHRELNDNYPQGITSSFPPRYVDVVICSKCGLIKRNYNQ